MTVINIQPTTAKVEGISVKGMVRGCWYKVVAYPYNEDIVGTIGVAAVVYDRDDGDWKPAFVTPCGAIRNHPDLRVQELKSVSISYEE